MSYLSRGTWTLIIFNFNIFSSVGSFTCDNRQEGYYADIESDCQQYHVCTASHVQYTHLCPNGTRFQQKIQVCEHSHLVDCILPENDFTSNQLQKENTDYDLRDGEELQKITQPPYQFHLNLPTSRPWPTLNILEGNKWYDKTTEVQRSALAPSFHHFNSMAEVKEVTESYSFYPPNKRKTEFHDGTISSPTLEIIKSREIVFPKFRSLQGNLLPPKRSNVASSVKLEWSLPDVRAMLYIPDDSSETVIPNIKRFSVTVPQPKMVFKRKSTTQPCSCSSHHCITCLLLKK